MPTSPEAAEAYRRNLPPGELEVFELRGFDHVGVPIVSALLHGGLELGAHGYGGDPTEALVGALGELTEDAGAARCVPRLPSRRASFAELGDDAVDPRVLCLPAGSPWTPTTPLTWVTATGVRSGEERWVPLEFVATSPSQLGGLVPLTVPITNGLGAGLSRQQAVAHGLGEVLQRDGNVLTYRALDQGVVVDVPDGVEPWLDRLRASGLDVLVKVASTDFGVCDLYVVGADRDLDRAGPLAGLLATACGEAASPDRSKALRKAVLEFGAARSRKAFTHGPVEVLRDLTPPGYLDRYLAEHPDQPAAEEPRALEAMVRWVGMPPEELRDLLAPAVLAERTRLPWAALPDDPGLDVVRALMDAGLPEPLVVDLSPPGGEVHAVKVVAPGLEAETMSYARIGERGVRRLLERGDPLAGLGAAPRAGCRPVPLTPEAEERLGGPAWLDVEAVDALVEPLYAMYREPGRHSAAMVLAGAVR